MKPWLVYLTAALIGAGLEAAAESPTPVRVALMDFSTDDNSWRNTQAAAHFTSLLQIERANEPGIEWVERAQLDLARQELKLSDMELLGGASPIRRGKWAKADWLITGQFSLDDKNQRTLALEITDLKHADVLASKVFRFPGEGTPDIPVALDQVKLAGTALHDLLVGARRRLKETGSQVLIAPLFLVNVSRFGAMRDSATVERGFYESLERVAATNTHVRFIRFPKAYQAMGESEMVLDGLVEADPKAWHQTADLYVWGSYALTNIHLRTGLRSKIQLTVHLWDGVSPPRVVREELPVQGWETLVPDVAVGVLDRVASEIVGAAKRQKPPADSTDIRHGIADSIAQSYRQLAEPGHGQLGLDDPAQFAQAVHMLETACFFDPNDAALQVMRITCRWGWWMEFGFKLKNPFWSHWRRSQAWGQYVDRFGLQPTSAPLPFPYASRGIPGMYVRSLEEALERFPQRYDEDDEQERQRSVHTAVKEAEAHGFPKDMPRDVVLKWEAEVEAELGDRKRRVSESSKSAILATNSVPPLATNKSASLPPGQPQTFARDARTAPGSNPGHPPQAQPVKPHSGPAPEWFKEVGLQNGMFKLAAPDVLPSALEPVGQTFEFPSQSEVRAVLRVGFCAGKVLILALDERSAPTSDAVPDLAAEVLTRRGRLWSLDITNQLPALFEPTLLQGTIHSFVVDKDRLWVAGDAVGCLDIETHDFRQFGLHDGLDSRGFHAVVSAGGRLFAAGDDFKLFQLEPVSSQWKAMPLPPARLSSGTGYPSLLTGNSQWLGYVAGSGLLYNVATATWTNLPDVNYVNSCRADESSVWYGTRGGLERYSLHDSALTAWHSPGGIRGLDANDLSSVLFPYSSAGVRGNPLNTTSNALHAFLRGLLKERANRKAEAKRQVDPLHLDSRMPGDITALAHDGEFLWIGQGAYSGGQLLLVHKPSLSLVGCCPLDGGVVSLAISDRDVWAGTAYGKRLLTRIEKRSMLSVPRSQWRSLAISSEERRQLISGMSRRDQAVYAFYAGEDARVAALLNNLNPDKASLEEMFLLAFAYDASGLDQPAQARAWSSRIAARYPDSPWAKSAEEFLAASVTAHQEKERQARLLATYDLNHDGVLDDAERRAMERDPAYQSEQKVIKDDQLDTQLQAIFKKYDRNGDGRLDGDELESLRKAVLLYADAPPEMLAGRKILVAPLLTKSFPPVDRILKQYDVSKRGTLDAAGLKALTKDLQEKR